MNKKEKNPLLVGVTNNVKIFLKRNLHYIPSDQWNERIDQIDKVLAASRICFSKTKNFVPLAVQNLEKLYGENWKKEYESYCGLRPRFEVREVV